MWCRHCQQDVPAIAKGVGGRVQCARCQEPFAADRGDAADAPQAPLEVEPWKASDLIGEQDERRLREIGLALRSASTLTAAAKPAPRLLRVDRPQPEASALHASLDTAAPTPTPAAAARPPAEARPPRAPSRPSQATAWLAALVGALALGAGIGLLGWSILGDRPDLWNYGVAATLGGQGLMIVGLVQLLANLWTAGRDATNRLVTLHYELRRLQRTADSLACSRTATPSAFYADLARGSSPRVLMANLRGQLDELASRYAAD